MALNDVLSTDTFEQWRVKTNYINANAALGLSNITSLQGNVVRLDANVASLSANDVALVTAIGLTNVNVATVNSNVATVNANVATVNSNVVIVNANVATVNANVNQTRSNLLLTDANVLAIQQQLVGGVGATTVTTITAFETINVGNVVNIFNNAGAFNVRNAKCLPGFEAHGYVKGNVAAGGTANVYLTGLNPNVSGLSPGYVWLSSSLGRISQTAPTLPGNVVQRLGFAVAATSFVFNFEIPVTLS